MLEPFSQSGLMEKLIQLKDHRTHLPHCIIAVVVVVLMWDVGGEAANVKKEDSELRQSLRMVILAVKALQESPEVKRAGDDPSSSHLMTKQGLSSSRP